MSSTNSGQIGPIQWIVCGFDRDDFTGKVVSELRDMRRPDQPVRLVGALFIRKDKDGNIEEKRATDLTDDEARRFRSAAGALIGLGSGAAEGAMRAGRPGALVGAGIGALGKALQFARHDYGISEDEIEEALRDLPNGSSALILLLEHHWALRAKQAFESFGGTFYASGLVTPRALVRRGAAEAIRDAVEAKVP